jgi:undecaprenyl diphosphate synthase
MSNIPNKIDKERLPKHVAIIMDGNGRWAKSKGKSRIFGHRQGVNTVRDIVEASAELGIGYLTLYTFSIENWRRPSTEIKSLMKLLVGTIKSELNKLIKNNIKLHVIGDISRIPETTMRELNLAIEKTKANTGLNLIMALSYSARWDITQAVSKIVIECKNHNADVRMINEEYFKNFLSTSEFPYPELLIRTSGEYRISNFLLWELAYTELYFTEKKWPEFTKDDLVMALIDYQHRERRFGKVSEQLAGS